MSITARSNRKQQVSLQAIICTDDYNMPPDARQCWLLKINRRIGIAVKVRILNQKRMELYRKVKYLQLQVLFTVS